MNEDIRFDEEKVTNAIDLLKDAQKDFLTADQMIYESIKSISNAQGIEFILKIDSQLNFYTPEKIIEECKDTYKVIKEEIENAVNTIKALNSDKLSSNPNTTSTEEKVKFSANEQKEEVTQNTSADCKAESELEVIETPEVKETSELQMMETSVVKATPLQEFGTLEAKVPTAQAQSELYTSIAKTGGIATGENGPDIYVEAYKISGIEEATPLANVESELYVENSNPVVQAELIKTGGIATGEVGPDMYVEAHKISGIEEATPLANVESELYVESSNPVVQAEITEPITITNPDINVSEPVVNYEPEYQRFDSIPSENPEFQALENTAQIEETSFTSEETMGNDLLSFDIDNNSNKFLQANYDKASQPRVENKSNIPKVLGGITAATAAGGIATAATIISKSKKNNESKDQSKINLENDILNDIQEEIKEDIKEIPKEEVLEEY